MEKIDLLKWLLNIVTAILVIVFILVAYGVMDTYKEDRSYSKRMRQYNDFEYSFRDRRYYEMFDYLKKNLALDGKLYTELDEMETFAIVHYAAYHSYMYRVTGQEERASFYDAIIESRQDLQEIEKYTVFKDRLDQFEQWYPKNGN